MGTITEALTKPLGTRRIADVIRSCSYDGMLTENVADVADRCAAALRVIRPTIVCLCGSTRFYEAFQRANYEETMAGRIVLSVGFYPHSSKLAHGQKVGCDDEQKAKLDELHLRKIDLADQVLVLNVGGYVGDSTRREIAYAEQTGKPLRWLEAANEAAANPQPTTPTPLTRETVTPGEYRYRCPTWSPNCPDNLVTVFTERDGTLVARFERTGRVRLLDLPADALFKPIETPAASPGFPTERQVEAAAAAIIECRRERVGATLGEVPAEWRAYAAEEARAALEAAAAAE